MSPFRCSLFILTFCLNSFGYLIKLVGRIPVFILGATINIIVIIVMFSWQPTLTTEPGECSSQLKVI
jgi:hypothetical protein